MKERMKRVLSLLILLGVLVSCILPLTSCVIPDECEHADSNGDYVCDKCQEKLEKPEPGPGKDPTQQTYTVVVKSVGGMAMSGVMVYLHDANDPDPYATVGRAKTDKNGVASFSKLNDKTYNVEISDTPNGYIVEDRYTFDASYTANITLRSAPISADDEDFRDLPDDFYYEIGDVIHDFTLTSTNGVSYSVADVLKDSQLLVINLWYTTCSACITEFPYLSKAYDEYNDGYNKPIVEVFGLNDHQDGSGAIKDFVDQNAFSFPCFDAVGQNGYSYLDFIRKTTNSDSFGYPTTIFVDRYGVICCIEVGALVNTKYWTNAFDHFTAENYQQMLVESVGQFTVIEKPDVPQPSHDEIDEALTGSYRDTENKIQVEYYGETDPDDAEYSWPFIITTLNGEKVIKSSNFDKDNSYATLYAKVWLNEGDALAFDYFSSCESEDNLIVLVDKKDIYTIRGQSEFDDSGAPIWETCCTYVAQADGYYEVAFVYLKDISDYEGDDTVYIKNLRVIDQSEIENETYIFRYAAFNPSEWGEAFNNYATVVYNPADGYYHANTIDGPLLLVNLLGYTQFDRNKTVFERAYAVRDDYDNPLFIINEKNLFSQFEKYGTYAANGTMYGFTPVTEELKTYLQKYVEDYRGLLGFDANENLWLSLCCYYDAYGKDVKQLENPCKGLSAHGSYKVTELDTPIEVTYNSIIIPRGYLYEYIPTESGVYTITTDSKHSMIGWIFIGDDQRWAEIGDRILYTSSETNVDRIGLTKEGYEIKCPSCNATVTTEKQYDEHGKEIPLTKITCHNADIKGCEDITDLTGIKSVTILDHKNVSMSVSMTAGTAYYIALAFFDPEQMGSFEFTVTKEDKDGYDLFLQASPGPFTYELENNGEAGSIIPGGLTPILCNDHDCEDCKEMALIQGDPEGTKYYHVRNADGSLGSILYADLFRYTSIFQSQSVIDLYNHGEFNFSMGSVGCEDCAKESDGHCKYHTDYSAIVKKYIDKMLNEEDHLERQGCVAITEELAQALQVLMHTHVFENVENAWIKFCYYYKHIGV